jgi:hypothetical protein
VSMVPAERSAACEPVVTNTMSFEATSTDIEAPPRSYLSRLVDPENWTGC